MNASRKRGSGQFLSTFHVKGNGLSKNYAKSEEKIQSRQKREWQEGFFDHRLRHDESLEEKTYYIRMNPVRAGLIEKPETWPYVFTAADLQGREASPRPPQPMGESGGLGEASLPRKIACHRFISSPSNASQHPAAWSVPRHDADRWCRVCFRKSTAIHVGLSSIPAN